MVGGTMRHEIRFAGFGGQGIVSAGRITGGAAVLHDGTHAVLTQNYGPEARGGACAAEVIVSDQPVDYPHITQPDALVIMSQEAYDKFSSRIQEGGLLLVDEDLVEYGERSDVKVVAVPSTRIAESLGRKIVANVVMLGALAAAWPAVSREAMLNGVLGSVPPHTKDLNQRAFEAGYEHVSKEAMHGAT